MTERTQGLRGLLRRTLVSLTLIVAGVAFWASPASAGVLEVANACDANITAAQAPAGTTIVLTGDLVQVCVPTFAADPATGLGVLLTGNGITIKADDVTLDLNGRSLISASDVLADSSLSGLRVTNNGVTVRGRRDAVVNSSTTVSRIENFTGNIDLRAEDSSFAGQLVDADADPATPDVANIAAGNAHGENALAISNSKRLTVGNLSLADLTGDTALEVKGSESVVLNNVQSEGLLNGARVRDSKFVTLAGSTLHGITGNGLVVKALEDGIVNGVGYGIFGNTISGNGVMGIDVSNNTKSVPITGNTIQNNAVCGIRLDLTVQNVTVAPNTFGGNVSGDVCRRP
jgi:hypothetical protein